MTDQSERNSKAPTHIAWHVRNSGPDGKAYWNRLGVAWAHADGEGFNVELNSLPLDGKVTVRRRREMDDEQPSAPRP